MEQEKNLSLPIELKFLSQVAVFGIISVLSFFIPFTLGHPQWLVGTVVNAGLFLGATFLPKRYFLPLAVLPSLGVLARGLVFGPLTMFLIYFLPIIWLGNLILIIIFRFLYSKVLKNFGISYFLAGAGAAAGKFALLFLAANLYFNFHWVPKLFVQAMGLNQLATALAGGLVAYLIWRIYQKKQTSF